MQLQEQKKWKFDYKWVIAAISFIIIFTALGFCSGNKGMYLKAITAANGIERSLFSINDSVRYITTAILNLFFGALVMKFGAKKLIVAGLGVLICSCLMYSIGTNIWMFYCGGFLLGVGMAWCTTTLVGYVVAKWFTENRGTVMGVILAANGLGVSVSAQIISPLIESGEFGYQTSYRVTALILAGVALLVLIFFKDAPKDFVETNEKPVAKKKPKRAAVWEGIPYEQVTKKYYFWVAAICIFLTGAAVQAVSGVTKAHLNDVGLPEDFVVMVWSFHGLALAAAKILAGFSFDKLGLKVTLLICQVIGAMSMMLLAFCTATSYVPAALGGVMISFALPLETIMLPLIAADMFGERSYAKIMGLIVSINTAGYAIGSPLTNLVYDKTGTYQGILIAFTAMMIAIAIAFQIILRSAGKDRAAIVAAAEERKRLKKEAAAQQ